MITYTGTRIEPSSKFGGKFAGTPNIIDIALGLGRMPRFGGHTRRWWSVLLHSLVCYNIAMNMADVSDKLPILCLLHDAHEAITADVPAFFKPKELKGWQAEIDERFFSSLGLWPISAEDQEMIKIVDDEALRAEALLLGPPTIMQHLSFPTSDSENVVRAVMSRFPDAASSEGLDSPAVRAFLDRFAQDYRFVALDTCDDTPSNQPTSAN